MKSLNLTGGDVSGMNENGGAVLVSGGIFSISNSIVWNNKALNGGAIYVQSGGKSHDTNTSFFSNYAVVDGGVFLLVGENSEITSKLSRFEKNNCGDDASVAFINGDSGLESTRVWKASRCLFVQNGPSLYGTVVSCYKGKMVLIDCNFNHNDGGNGGAVKVYNNGRAELVNCFYLGNANRNVKYDGSGGAGQLQSTCSGGSNSCVDNGYPYAICTTRQNPDEGVICAQNCSAG